MTQAQILGQILKREYLNKSGKYSLSREEKKSHQELMEVLEEIDNLGAGGVSTTVFDNKDVQFDVLCDEMKEHAKSILRAVKHGEYKLAKDIGM